MYKILITGGDGFLGRYIKSHLSSIGKIDILGLSHDNEIQCDLAKNTPDINVDYDYIIHAAGKAHTIAKNKFEIDQFYHINHIGTINLLKGIEKQKVQPKGIIFISTVAVYGIESGYMIDESTPLNAIDPYGESKKLAEEEILKWGDDRNVSITILRLPLVVGKNAPGNLGAMIKAISSHRFKLIGEGDARRSMVLAKDVANFIAIIMDHGGIYNLTDGYHPTFKELANIIENKYDAPHVRSIPTSIAKIIALFFDLIQFIFRRDMPFNSRKLKKMTSSLTFDDKRARTREWHPKKVIEAKDDWL